MEGNETNERDNERRRKEKVKRIGEEEKVRHAFFSPRTTRQREIATPTSKNMGRPRMPSVGSFSVVFLRRAAMSRRSD